MVKRYDKIVSTNSDGYITYMREQSDGAYVLYEDYEALEKEVWELRNENAGMDVIKQKLAESKSEIADLRSIEREHIKTIAELEQKANRYRNLANQMIDDLCVVCKVHNPQHKDCTSCGQVEDYRETLTEGREL